ncbi:MULTISPECIES: bifunctional UDP-N-acetylglucosamine diphosphorylase/glucosamine-1-phosphate N-acetyltransferase GlmU [unclassified Viridibacillus]|uniref:bifunctional UDP-N-acetylglucosamine diphosphorylase/glucosamine-1-phosphate N-acetyltransferase GlmU n=1 Tax=unclassified Viridibacillus TaxID=2617942 RepID=UPI00096C3074|nr:MULTISPECIES: bifunctional UDP-N-acetylglucosamine diphosphorylase/glucosamine-1-phosphate N-acetyltransferase GlmU [unclassified Viridibacillus]OMC78343.1 UDP-N-acetylglucosamine diphosphorylase/glucosamine-1-phosphate N-acetyltransferase [Viridibacillus sp. FSL H8-0123]OMC81946.1 UDP-N-acetylglucosamine diphosphorylase/glucosamine-1-phosphate N-acetyltransferase [Viridibacillus sp. FSL H7-0596]
MTNVYAVILAAGQGTRMKSKLYKVLHPVCGKPMVEHVVDHIQTLDVERIVTIVGYGAEKVKEQLGEKSEYVLQAEQLGTAHAVQQVEPILGDLEGTTIVICGDTPLIRPETMKALFEHHESNHAKATILTAIAEDPTGYGRILRSTDQQVAQIVEQKDATPEQRQVKEINTGTYCFDNKALFAALKLVKNDNAQGEYYLPDVIEILQKQGEVVAAYVTENFAETLGVNDRFALSQAEETMRARINEQHMRNGVTIINPSNTYISVDAQIGRDTVIQPGVIIEGASSIGEDCIIGPNSHIQNSRIGNRTTVHSSVVRESVIGEDTAVGPFAHIRPDSDLGDRVKIGNFVEVKKTKIDNGSKVSHLSYLGDAEVGTEVNIGCGTITVNYDGKNKFKTVIEDNAFVGCNSNLVAPVTVGKGSYVAAGSTITKDIPADALAIARSRQENKDNYVTKLKLK